MRILGINAYHGDSSASIVIDGKLIAAVEEERFTRIKHWAGLPVTAIRYCLKEAHLNINDIDFIAINRNPRAHILRKGLFILKNVPSFDIVRDRLKNAFRITSLKKLLSYTFKEPKIRASIFNVEHHIAHIASTFFISPFDKAALVSVDGFGDFVGTMWGVGEGNKIIVKDRIFFPHSLGLYYLALTQFLGFPKYGDEYKVMGLAAYGEPSLIDDMKKLVILEKNGRFKIGLDYFVHHKNGAKMTWDGGAPVLDLVFSKKLERLFGPIRKPEEPIQDRHKDIASSLQTMYEEAFFHILNHVYKETKIPYLCLSGGCAMNSVANGKIFDKTSFREIFIQPAAGDAGGAIGAAFYLWNHILNSPREFVMEHAYLGPQYSSQELLDTIALYQNRLEQMGCIIEREENKLELCKKVARLIADGKVIGWFQGRMEWGPRALGNRSILADPRRAEMRDILNERIKRRESFRPFAPAILYERVGDFFEKNYPDPFMLKVYPVKKDKQHLIPATTHVDGTGRLQTVSKKENPLFWQLIKEFENITGVPVVLNTSFNENEPIVCSPKEAMECFIRTKMDILVLGEYLIYRES